MAKYLVIFLFLGMGIIACSSELEKPDNLIPEEKYTTLLVELQLVRSYGENAKVDTATIDSLTTAVYEKYAISDQQFQLSHHYYQQFPDKQKNRVDAAIEQLKMELVTQEDTTAQSDSL